MALHSSLNNSINYNDLNAGVIYPSIKVYVRLNPEFDDDTVTVVALTNDYTDEWDSGTKRMEITDYVINVGNVSFEGENEIFSDTTGNGSVTLDVIKEIPHTTRSFFIDNHNENIFTLLKWSDKTYSIFHIEFSLLDDVNGSIDKTITLFQGKLTTLTSRDNTIQLKIDDGLIESTHKQSLIGKKIFDEVIKYEDRFFITEENKKSNLTASNVFGGWVLDSVKKTKEFNLVNAPIIKPERDSQVPIIRGYIKRFDKGRIDSAKQKNTSDGRFYWGDDFTEIDFSEKIGDDNELKFNRAEIDYENGILNFEVPPIRQPDGFLYIDHYKTPYRYKHPAFLAEKLFESLGYENVNFEKKKLNPYHPNPLNFNQDFKNKKINKYGQISPLKSGKNYGAKIIKYCEYDGLFYYFTKGGIYRTDLNELNEKIITTQLRIVDMELILIEDTPNFLRIVVTAKSYEEIKIGDPLKKTNNEMFINPYCQKNTKGSEEKPEFVWETLDPALRIKNEKTQLPDRDLIQKPTTYFNEWLDDSTVTLHFYDFINNDGFQNNILWLEEDTVYESTFNPDGDKGSYNTPTKLFNFKYNEKVNGVITKYEDGGDEYVDIPCRIVVKKGVDGNIPQTDEEVDLTPIYSLISSYKAFHWENAPNFPQIKLIYDYNTDQHQVEDKEIVDVIYKYNLDDNTGFGEGYTLIWKNGFPLEVYNHAINERGDFEQDFAWTYWTTESLTSGWTGGDIVGSQELADVLIEKKYLKKIRVLSLEDEDDFSTEHFYEIITHNPINNTVPMSNETPGSNSNGLFYIFGNELTNNILVSNIEKDGGGIKKTQLYFMGVDRHFHDYYQYADELEGEDAKWGNNEYDNQYFCFVRFNIENPTLKLQFNNFKVANYTYSSGGETPVDYTYRFDFTDHTNAIKWNMKGYNWRFPIHSTFIGGDMIIEKESQSVNQLYILFNDKIIRFKHRMIDVVEESDFLVNKEGSYPNNNSEVPYVTDKQFMACNGMGLENGEFVSSKSEDSDHFFAHIKYPYHSHIRPILLNYEYMLNNSVSRKWDKGNGFIPPFNNVNYRDIYRSKNFSSGLREYPESLIDWDNTIYDQSEAPYLDNPNWNDKPIRPYMYAMNYYNELSNRTIGLRVHQVYGLSKLKRDESWSNVPELQDMAKFSFIAVNRDYLVKNQIGSDCNNTKRWNLSGMKKGSAFKSQYRMSFGEHDELYLPDTLDKDHLETNVVSGISIMFFVDFSKENSVINFNDTSKKRGKLFPISSTLPSILHEDYYEFLDPVTQEFDEMFLNKSNRGEFDSSVKFDEDSKSKINLAILKTIKTGYPLTNPSGHRISILGKSGIRKVLNHANRQGGDWDLFPISGWLNDLLMVFDKILTTDKQQYISPYKSQYFPFSFKNSPAGTKMYHMTTQWMVNSRIGGKLTGSSTIQGETLAWSAVQNNIEVGVTGTKLVASPNYLFSFFDHFLVSLRRDFAQRYIMNSLLPKCSKDIGDSIITEVGNWGEYLTTHNFSTLPDSFMDLNEFDTDSNNSVKYQNSHGTLLLLGSNHISGSRKQPSIKVHKTKHVHYINKDLVYKDFLSKPIICTIDGRTESHFSIGSSIGYKSLYKEARFDNGKVSDMYKKTSIFNREYNISEKTDALMSYRLFDQENMIWCSLEDFIEPRIPVFNSTDQTIFQSLQQLGSLMDYRFGIKNGVPYFEDKENLFRVKYDTKILNDGGVKKDYLNKHEQTFDDTGFKLSSYYFILGEIIQIDATESVNGGEVVHRSVEYSKSKISDNEFTINSNVTIYGVEEDVVRISEIGTNQLDANIYEVKSVINEKNLIEISKYNRLYVNDYSDYEITYGNSNMYRRKLNNIENFKNTFTLDVPQINDFDWIEYLARKIERNVNKLRFNLNMSIKFNPTITNGDYIAMYEPIHKIGYELTLQDTPAVDPHADGTNYKRYELFKVQSATHNLENYTSSINCYSVDVNYSSITQG